MKKMLVDYAVPHWIPVFVERFNINPSLAQKFLTKIDETSVEILAEHAGMLPAYVDDALSEIELASAGIFSVPTSEAAGEWNIYLDTDQPSSAPSHRRLNKWDQGFTDTIKSIDQSKTIICNSKHAALAYSAAMAFRVKGYSNAFAQETAKEQI